MSAPAASIAVPHLRTFILVWVGQLVSLLGSGLTAFAIGLHVYQESGSVTQFALINFFVFAPAVLLSPVAGALVDRWDRRRAMLLADLGAGASSALTWLLIALGRAELWSVRPWHFYLPIAIGSVFAALRWPAYQATTALLVPPQHLGRANGFIELAMGASNIAAPVLAAALLGQIGLEGIVLIDGATFIAAVVSLLLVRFPAPPRSAAGQAAQGSLRREVTAGWAFIRARPGLLGLLWLLVCINLALGLVTVLLAPLVLSFADVPTLGRTQSIAGAGMLVGGVVMSAWGGPRRRIAGVLGATLLSGSVLLVGALPPSAALITAASALFLATVPVISGCAQVIWQVRVPPDMHGRVFAVRRMIALSAPPLSALIAGPLAADLFEPWMAPGGALAGSVGRVIGVGPGRGIGLLFAVLGAALIAVVLAAWASPSLRRVEDTEP